MMESLVGVIVGWLVSIISDPIKEILWGPRLSIAFEPGSPVDSHMTPMFDETGRVAGNSFWLRVRVLNAGRSVARDVEVIARRLFRQVQGGKYELVAQFAPLNLKWSYIGKPVMERIPKQIERLCDVFSIPDPEPGAPPPSIARDLGELVATPTARLELVAHSAAQPGSLLPGAYKLELVAIASNSSAIEKELVFTVPDEWRSDWPSMAKSIGANLRASFPRP